MVTMVVCWSVSKSFGGHGEPELVPDGGLGAFAGRWAKGRLETPLKDGWKEQR